MRTRRGSHPNAVARIGADHCARRAIVGSKCSRSTGSIGVGNKVSMGHFCALESENRAKHAERPEVVATVVRLRAAQSVQSVLATCEQQYFKHSQTALPTSKRSYDPVDRLSLVLLGAMHLSCLFVFFVPFSGVSSRSALAAICCACGRSPRAIIATSRIARTRRAARSSSCSALLGTCAMQNGPIWWASWHRHHHRYSDTPQDAHSPLQRGFWHAHMGWILSGDFDRPRSLERHRPDALPRAALSRSPQVAAADRLRARLLRDRRLAGRRLGLRRSARCWCCTRPR